MTDQAPALLQPELLRSLFPVLQQQVKGQPLAYLDNAATTQTPLPVQQAMLDFEQHDRANIHRGVHTLSQRATDAFEAARSTVKAFIGAGQEHELAFTSGTTEALNTVAFGLWGAGPGKAWLRPGDEIIVSGLEHHANLLPWQQLALRQGLRLVVLPLDERGDIDLEQAASLIGPRTRLLAISQLSNVLGRQQPVARLVDLARAQGALSVVDGAQGAVHGRQDVQALGCDFYVCSGHKLYGPDGVGLLYGRREALAQLRHWQFGGEMVLQADYQRSTFRPAPLGFEAGTPAIAAVIALGATLDYLAGLDQAAVATHEAALHAELLAGLGARAGIRLVGAPQLALASFTVDGVHSADLAHLLTEQGIAVRSGHHCAMPLLKSLGLPGAIRVSLGLYNDGEDLARLFVALDKALELLQ